MGFGIFIVFPEVCSLPDLANIADGSRPRQVLRHTASGRTSVSFCKIDKIMFADSENQGHKRYFMKI